METQAPDRPGLDHVTPPWSVPVFPCPLLSAVEVPVFSSSFHISDAAPI